MTSPSEPPAPGSSKDPQIEAFAAELRQAQGSLPKLLQPLPAQRREEIIERAFASRSQAKVVPAASRFSARRWTMVGSALALAATVLLFVYIRNPQGTAPEYLLDISGDAEVRSSEVRTDGPVRLRPSTRLVVRLRPQKPRPAAALRVLLVQEGKTRTLDVAYRVEAGGVFVVDAPAQQALGNQVNGPAVLVFVVGPSLPEDDELKTIAADPQTKSTSSFALLRKDVVFTGWESSRRELQLQDLELVGCQGFAQGPACEFAADTELRLWVPSADVRARVVSPNDTPAIVGKNVLGGTQLLVKPPSSATHLEMVGSNGERIFQLPLRAVQEDSALRAAFAALQKNACEEAAKHLDVAERNPAQALAALRIRARLARRCGDVTEAKRLLENTAAKARAAGRLSDEADDRHLLAYILITRDFDFAAAQGYLWPVETSFEQCPECRLDIAYYRSIWAVETGRYEEALRQLDRVLTTAHRLDLQDRLRAARSQQMLVLATLGRMEEVEELARLSLADAATLADPCAQAKLRTSAAWALLHGAEANAKDISSVRPIAAAAVNDARTRCPASLVNALINAAYTEVHLGEASKAKALFSEALEHQDPTDVRMASWLEALDVDVTMLDHPQKALAILDKRTRNQNVSVSPELSFRLAAGRARAWRKIGNVDETRVAFAQAHEALDTWSRLVPLGEGRESFFEQQRSWAREAVDFEVGLAERLPQGTPDQEQAIRTAANEAQRNLGRFFQTLTATEVVALGDQTAYRRARQRESAAAKNGAPIAPPHAATLPPTTADPRNLADSKPLQLVYHPVRRGWVGFALEKGGAATMARLSAVPLSAKGPALEKPTPDLAQALLDPFAAAISRTSDVDAPALGPLRRVPWEALPWKGRVLGDAVQVRYRVPATAPESAPCAGPLRALVVLDPSATLAGAEMSAGEVRKGLLRMHFEVVELSGNAAERRAVLRELTNPCTQLFHYDGHASFRGRDGVFAALELAGEALTVADVLALPRVPEAVALLGCETAKDDGMGVAQAFLSRGAKQVLAAMDTVDDKLSAAIARRLYAQASGDTLDLARALRVATRAARDLGEGSSDAAESTSKLWWLFRILTR